MQCFKGSVYRVDKQSDNHQISEIVNRFVMKMLFRECNFEELNWDYVNGV
jgi:hypothetical protein